MDRVDKEEAKDYVRGLLLARKDRKNLVYSPSQVELRSLPIPGMHYMNRLFGDYYAECARLGFKNRFDRVGFSGAWKKLADSHRIIVDTREQLPLVFDEYKTVHEPLMFGDYKLNDDAFTHNCCIERKSIGDLYSTLTNGIARFRAELQRATDAGFNLIVLIEEPFETMYELSRRLKRLDIVISPEYVFHNIRMFSQEFPFVQFLFVADRNESSEVIIKLFQSDGQFKHIDLQYAYDTLNLCGTSRPNT